VAGGDDATNSSSGASASAPTLRLGPRDDLMTVPDRPGGAKPGESAADLEDRPNDPLLPARIGRFAINRQLATGGMGVVYEAEDRELGRKIAIKLLRTSLPGADDDDDRESVDALMREAQTLAKLDHPNVVAVHEVGRLEGEVWVAMEFIEGQTLRQWLRERPREWPEVRDALVQAGRGLAAAHRAGLVHRDFKPENAMIDVQGRVRVLDFGLARAAGTGPPSSLVARMLRSGTAGLGSTSVAGTPAYMAPEQHLGLPCDARSDQFSFCVALYEGLYGVRPFPDGDAAQRFQAIMAGELRKPVRGRKAPLWLRAALVRGLQSVPSKRFPNMDALLDALTEAPKRRRRAVVAVSLVGLSAIVAGLGLSLYVETRDACGQFTDRVG
jgi:serine/threonine protein kinase